MFNINFANDRIQTADLWYRNRPLFQLYHNHSTWTSFFALFLSGQKNAEDVFHLIYNLNNYDNL